MALSINRTQAPGERRPQGLEGGDCCEGHRKLCQHPTLEDAFSRGAFFFPSPHHGQEKRHFSWTAHLQSLGRARPNLEGLNAALLVQNLQLKRYFELNVKC